MRWTTQRLDRDDAQALPGLGGVEPLAQLQGLVRTVRPPDFPGATFHEVLAKSALSRVPEASTMPFRWTLNPYRGCTHACVYCYARGSHAWLDLDTGAGFDSEIVVKTNLVAVLRRELADGTRPGAREHVALGTNTDPYQRAEGRYRLMPGVIGALHESGTPFSVLTKGTLLRRDLPLLAAAARDVPVGIGVSLAVWDDALHEAVEPGTPGPRARLALVRAVREAGLPCGVFMAPVLPGLTDSAEQLDAALGELAAAGATGVTVLPLHLRPGAKEWWAAWLKREHPELVGLYRDLYGRGAYVPRSYAEALAARVAPLLERHGLAGASSGEVRGTAPAGEGEFPEGSMPVARRVPVGPSTGPGPGPAGAGAGRMSGDTLF